MEGMQLLLNSVYGRDLKHAWAGVGPRRYFVRPAMRFQNFQIINI